MIKVFPSTVKRLGLYPIVDSIYWIEALLEIGVRTIQLRIKNSYQNNEIIDNVVYTAIKLGKKYTDSRIFINDYWELAIKYQAYGVHLGQEDLAFADLNKIRDAGLRLGLSTHNELEVRYALQLCPSYIALGHIFHTKTKKMKSSPQGIAQLKNHVKFIKDRTSTVAIGGISIAKVPEVLETGVGSIAVVSAITEANDWRKATHQLRSLIEK